MSAEPEIMELTTTDADAVAALLASASADYLRHAPRFLALPAQLRERRADRWWGFREKGQLLGFFMLRGFDAGFARPSFGVFISEPAAGRGLARRALDHALAWCHRSGIHSVMLKVAAANLRARELYVRAGFHDIGLCPETGQQMLGKEISHP